jgi:predicted AAA+ superfamily ATPase
MLYCDLVERYEIRDVSIGKDTLYQMIDGIFSIYMLAYVEKYDPAVIKREMSNKRVYLFDNGFVAATQYSFSEDRGKRLENIVYRHLREKTEAIFFIRNKWECDESAKRSLGAGKCLLLVDSVQKGLEIPDWVAVQSIQEWLLEQT